MLTLESLDITSYDVNKLTISWDLESTPEALSGYSIGIYRSENPGISGLLGFDLLESGIAPSAYVYEDYGVSGLFDPLRTWYYKLKFTEISSLTESVQPNLVPAYRKGTTSDLAALEIVRRKNISLSTYAGRDFFLIKKRTYGTHCPICWDTTLQRVDIDCAVCYGTGWTDGYFKAIYLKGMLNPAPKYNQITMFGEWMPHDALFTMLNFPPIRTRDIVVDDRNQRWIVKQIRKTEKLGYVIEHNAQCQLIAQDDLIYDLEKNTLEIARQILALDVVQAASQTTTYAVVKQLLDSYWYDSSLGQETIAVQWVNNFTKAVGVYTTTKTATISNYNVHTVFEDLGVAENLNLWSVFINTLNVPKAAITSITNNGSNIIISFNSNLYDLHVDDAVELWGPLTAV